MKKILFTFFIINFLTIQSSRKDSSNRVFEFKKELAKYEEKRKKGKMPDSDYKSWYQMEKSLRLVYENKKMSKDQKEECLDLFIKSMGISD